VIVGAVVLAAAAGAGVGLSVAVGVVVFAVRLGEGVGTGLDVVPCVIAGVVPAPAAVVPWPIAWARGVKATLRVVVDGARLDAAAPESVAVGATLAFPGLLTLRSPPQPANPTSMNASTPASGLWIAGLWIVLCERGWFCMATEDRRPPP
jgi:hypothetical protein